MAENLFSAIKRQALLADEVIVSYSGGKDSAVVLDLCAKHFKTIHVFFMYQVRGLSFQEAVLNWAEQKYGVEIYRIPHFEVSNFYKYGSYIRPDHNVPIIKVKDIYDHVQEAFGCRWIAAGERAKDSIIRNAMIKKSGSIDLVRDRFYPIAYWSKQQVMTYIKMHNLKVSPESALLGHSFRSLDAKDLMKVKQYYPDDFELIKRAFPECEVAIAREVLYGQNEIPEI